MKKDTAAAILKDAAPLLKTFSFPKLDLPPVCMVGAHISSKDINAARALVKRIRQLARGK